MSNNFSIVSNNLDIWIGMLCLACLTALYYVRKCHKQKKTSNLQRIQILGLQCGRDRLQRYADKREQYVVQTNFLDDYYEKEESSAETAIHA